MLFHLLLIFLEIPVAFSAVSDLSMPTYGNALTRAVTDIIEVFYVQRTNNINIYQMGADDQAVRKNYETINEILYHVKLMEVSVRLESHEERRNVRKKRVNSLIFLDNFDSFLLFFNSMYSLKFDYQGFYLIVLTTYTYEQYALMSNIFSYLWNEYITNVNIIWMSSDSEAMLYTYFPFTNFYCGKTYPVQLNQYSFGQWTHHRPNIFPSKMRNLHGCPLSAAIILTGPFMSLLKVANGTILPDGIDGVLLRVISQRMNFTLNLVPMYDQGTFYENGTIDGAAGLVINRQVNFTMGFTSMTADKNQHMTPSFIYHTSNLVWMVPPGRLLNSMEKLGKPFRTLLWIFVCMTFLIGFFIVIALRFQSKIVQNFVFGREISTPSLNIVNVFFGGSLHKLPRRNFARFLLGFFMFYCLVIRSSYQGALFDFMKGDFREQHVKDIATMIKKDFKFHVVRSSVQSVSELPEVMKRIVLFEREEVAEVRLKVLQSDFKGSMLASEEHVAYTNKLLAPDRFMHYADEIVSVFNLCIYMHRQTCLVDSVNENIMKLTNSGLMDSWMKHFVDRSYLKLRKDQQPRQLDIEKLTGAYKLLVTGLALSFIVFIVELISPKVKCLHRVMRYL